MASIQGSLRSLRQGNRDRLLDLLREHGALHRAELARRTGLSRTTVSNIVGELLEEELLVEADGKDGNETGGHAAQGRRTGQLTLNPAAGAALGIDFSFSRVHVVVANLGHKVLASQTAPLAADLGWAERLEAGAEMVERMLADAGVPRSSVLGAGLGVPGPVDLESGEVGASSNSLMWRGVRAADELGQRLGMPVRIDNTGHLGSLAEVVWGAGSGCRNVIYLKLSTGVAAGFVLDGQVFRGSLGAAGEIGHITVDESGPACRCGNRGCLEVYVGTAAILSALEPALGDVSIHDVLRLAAEGNRSCRRVIGDAGFVVGRALAGICNLLNPERIVVGGELAAAGDVLLEPIAEAIRRHALEIASNAVQVVRGELGENAGALGGVALVLREGERLVSASA